MNISIHPTSKIVDLQTDAGLVAGRIWEGVTDTGIPVHCFIVRIVAAIPDDDPRVTEFRQHLLEVKAPSVEVLSYPLKLIL